MGYTKWTDELKKRVQELHNKGMASPEIVESLYAETGIYYPVRSVRRYMNPKQQQPCSYTKKMDYFYSVRKMKV
ncbi:MAG: hypothetical protein WA079_09240 [Leuconostoc falkenbergense]|uniref:hypothetical protein n=1 Tax=Leuconostoc falkenbergense TaxID=2766470 RepID=UPI003BB5EAB3